MILDSVFKRLFGNFYHYRVRLCITQPRGRKLYAEVTMKKLLIGAALGVVAGAVAYKKMQDGKVAEKVLEAAKEKMSD